MAIRSFPFNSDKGDRKYKAEDFAVHQSNLYTNGILGNESNNLQVYAKDSMNVYVNKGVALVNGVTMLNDSNYDLKIDIADSVLNRIDKIVLRLDKVKRTLEPAIKKGSYGSNPVPPALQQDVDIWEIGLAEVRVNKGVIKITQADIRDLRHTKECGIATFRGMPINLDSLYIQYENELKAIVSNTKGDLQELLKELNNILGEDEFGKLIAIINKKQDKIIKDTKNENEYMVEVTDGRPFLRVVK